MPNKFDPLIMSAEAEEVAAKKSKLEEAGDGVENAAKPETDSTKDLMELPRKKFYRQRAHANPLSDREMFHPASPET